MGEALSAVSPDTLIGNLGDPLIRFPIFIARNYPTAAEGDM